MIAARISAALSLLVVAAACGRSADRASDTATTAVVTDTATTAAAAAAAAAPRADTTPVASAGDVATQGAMLDPNTATREQLLAVPGVAGHVADAIVGGRPYADNVALNKVLVAHVPDSTARKGIYARVWKPIDLNTATDEEILLIPGIGRRMLHEFKEYRPYKLMEQFRREIGKYVDKEEVARLEKYVTIKGQ